MRPDRSLSKSFEAFGDYAPALREAASEFGAIGGFAHALREFVRGAKDALASLVSPAESTDTPSGLSLAMGGEALAVGARTTATGAIDVDLADLGAVSIATGEAALTASARGARCGDDASTDAETYAEFSNADFVFVFQVERDFDFGRYAYSHSETRVFAIDIEGFEFANGPMIRTGNSERGGGEWGSFLSLFAPGRGPAHVAEIAADADATSGPEGASYSFAETSSLTTDTLSHIAGYAFGVLA